MGRKQHNVKSAQPTLSVAQALHATPNQPPGSGFHGKNAAAAAAPSREKSREQGSRFGAPGVYPPASPPPLAGF